MCPNTTKVYNTTQEQKIEIKFRMIILKLSLVKKHTFEILFKNDNCKFKRRYFSLNIEMYPISFQVKF